MSRPSPILPETVILQSLCLPDPAITAEEALFLRPGPGVRRDGGALLLEAGARVDFDTYANLFDLGLWSGACGLDGLRLRLCGAGRVTLHLARLTPGGPEPRGADPAKGPAPLRAPLADHALALDGGAEVDLAPWIAGGGLIALAVTAATAARLEGGEIVTRTTAPAPRLAISITTFRREEAVAATARRIADFLDHDPAGQAIAPGTHLFVVDNGDSADLPDHPRLTRIANRNLGGAGGFARGLLAARDGGFSHCLFMDDDASFQMESLIRTHAFLRLARDPAAAVAGAMISAGRPWAVWENGAVFDRFCRPCDHGADLREADQVARMLFRAAQPKPRGFYGGWWFFAFPLARVEYWPFPFFVRGDDISFSLANGFATSTINGVVSFQEDFAAKESPQTLYLDLRNHLHHHLVQDGMEIGAGASAAIALRFIGRSLARMHYDSAEAQLLAWEDVMTGPGHFVANADMAARRAHIAGLIRTEGWKPDKGLPAALGTTRKTAPSRLTALLGKLTLNGHLLPFFGLFGGRIEVDIRDRGLLWPVWGAREALYRDPEGGRFYAVRHDKARFARLLWRILRLRLRWGRVYPDLVKDYRARYPEIAARPFWEGQFAGTEGEG